MSERLKQYWAMKQANPLGDTVDSIMPGPVFEGAVHGLSKDDLTIPEDDLGYVPGVGISRIIRRLRRVRKDLAPNSRRQRSRIFVQEPLLQLLSLASLPLIGGGIGAAVGKEEVQAYDIIRPEEPGEKVHFGSEKGDYGPGVYAGTKQKYPDSWPDATFGTLTGQAKLFKFKNRELGSMIGAGAGLGAAIGIPVIAAILAAARRKRTKGEQTKAEARPLRNHLIPGYTPYEVAKRLGASTHFEETPKERGERLKSESIGKS